jgi:hypothetical protein
MARLIRTFCNFSLRMRQKQDPRKIKWRIFAHWLQLWFLWCKCFRLFSVTGLYISSIEFLSSVQLLYRAYCQSTSQHSTPIALLFTQKPTLNKNFGGKFALDDNSDFSDVIATNYNHIPLFCKQMPPLDFEPASLGTFLWQEYSNIPPVVSKFW